MFSTPEETFEWYANELRKVGIFARNFPDNVGFRIVKWTSENYKRKLALGNKPMLLYAATT
ncbi:hypothetical protein [Providencia manganoxydans]